ncbi:MAG: putative metal-binding motif-containing protein [Bacteroidota bacterium]|nr:MAG: putative metal-binding motif-containing protein [Bacteroidota bacterium]
MNAAGSYSLRSTCGSSFTTSNVVTVSVQTVNTYFQDSDGDGYGNPNDSLQSCTQPSGYVFSNTDCNDANSQVHPGASETCNGVDDDCDGLIDENVQTVWYADADGDTYGNLNDTLMSCSQPSGYVALSGDCNDANTQVHPAATEVCNGIDDDCDGQTDEGLLNTYYADSDGDGYGNAASSVQACSAPSGYVIDNTDCDDNVAGIHAPLTYFVDADQDGFGSSTSVLLCSLNAPIGYSTNSLDCNDGDFMIKPTGLEICNGIDDDCDGLTDMADPSLTGAPVWYADADGDSFGDPVVSQTSCAPIPGYVSNNQDCDDSDSLEFPGQIWYIDQDGDQYGAGVTQVSCLRPLHGYHVFELTSISGDCNDNDATIHPAAQFLRSLADQCMELR